MRSRHVFRFGVPSKPSTSGEPCSGEACPEEPGFSWASMPIALVEISLSVLIVKEDRLMLLDAACVVGMELCEDQ